MALALIMEAHGPPDGERDWGDDVERLVAKSARDERWIPTDAHEKLLEGTLLRRVRAACLPELAHAYQDEYHKLCGKDVNLPTVVTEELKAGDPAIREKLIVLACLVRQMRTARVLLARIRWTLAMFIPVGLALVSALAARLYLRAENPEERIAILGVAGALGAMVSSIQRLYSLTAAEFRWFPPYTRLVSLGITANQLLALFEGWLFAVVLFLLFKAGIVTGTIFPAIDECCPTTCADVAKVLVWGFVAGFSERLVPDLMDTLSKQVDIPKKK